MIDKIRMALELLVKNQGDGWILIFEDPETEAFVQFAFDSSSGLYFDLPFQALNEQQIQLARKELAQFDIFPFTAPSYTGTSESESEQKTFNADMGNNTDLSAQVTEVCFTRVYRLPCDTHINVTIMR